MKFERHSSRVVFDPSSLQYVVTWTRCGVPEAARLAAKKDPMSWIPSVHAISTLYDRGCVPQEQAVYAAMAIGRAWASGDRDQLDTEGARNAAELVHDLSTMCVDANSPAVAKDVCQALRHLLDEMAKVKFMNLDAAELEDAAVIPALEKAAAECSAVDGFWTWPPHSMRRRFLFCLNRKERTPVAYTLVSLAFDCGSCPLLSLSDRRVLRMMSSAGDGDSDAVARLSAFFRVALSKMRSMKREGRTTLGAKMTQNQLADSVADSSASN